MTQPLMPKATAVWLVENTSLTFEQIGEFCGLHPLEVKGIADGDVAQGIKGLDPVVSGQLSRDQIDRAQKDPGAKLTLAEPAHAVPERKRRRGPRYTPLSRRQDRPDAIYWLIRNHPEVSDAQIAKLVGTTKPTIQSIRQRTHWNAANLKPVDPVTLGLCSQIELDEAVQKAAQKKSRAEAKARKAAQKEGTIQPTEVSLAPPVPEPPAPEPEPEPEEETPPKRERRYSADEVFSRFEPAPKEEKGSDGT